MNTDILKSELISLIAEINKTLSCEKLVFHQQSVQKTNISVIGGNGRLYINPTSKGYNIGLSGLSLTDEMYSYMCDLTGKVKHDKFGFPALKRLPKWEVESFSIVKKSVIRYSKTIK